MYCLQWSSRCACAQAPCTGATITDGHLHCVEYLVEYNVHLINNQSQVHARIIMTNVDIYKVNHDIYSANWWWTGSMDILYS